MTNPINRLLEMLEFRRPAGTVYEEAFIDRYLKPYNPTSDSYGNLMIDVGTNPSILWSAHTDTVHHNSGLQQLFINKKNEVRVIPHKESNCLGADDTTGVWMLLEMLDAGIPGRYIFHRAEEIGGLGSKYIAKNTPDVVKGIQAAIAFDRKGQFDIITHQGSRTASDQFAHSMGRILGGGYKPSPNGSFTDTKSYMALIPECTNISVGYGDAHRATEYQDLTHARWLRDVMVKFDSSTLVISRTPAEPEVYNYSTYTGAGTTYRGAGHWRSPQTIFDLVNQNPTTVSKILEQVGFDFLSLQAAIEEIQHPFIAGKGTIDPNLSLMKDKHKRQLTKTRRSVK